MSSTFKAVLISGLVLGLGGTARAAAPSDSQIRRCESVPVVFDKVALDGAAGTRTKTISNLSGYDLLRITAKYTWVDDGDLTFTITVLSAQSSDTATEALTGYSTPTYATCTGSVCTLADRGTYKYTGLTAAKTFDMSFRLQGETTIKIVAEESTAASGEFLTLTAEKCVAGGN